MAIEATALDTNTQAKAANRAVAPAVAANDDAMTFGDLLDVINPLQQLPIVGSIYREVTGDTIKPAARIMGGVLFGALTGGLSLIGCVTGGGAAMANLVVEQKTGKDIAGNALALVRGGDESSDGDGSRTAPIGAPIRITPLPPPSGSTTDAARPVVDAPAKENKKVAINWLHRERVTDNGLAAIQITADDIPELAQAKAAARVETAAAPSAAPRSGGAERSPPVATDVAAPVVAAPTAVADASRALGGGTPLTRLASASGLADGTTDTARHLLAAGEVPHPTRMPTRDTIPANTMQARRAAQEVAARRYTGRDASTPVARAATAPVSPAPTGAGAPTPLVQGIDRATLPEVMMRNLEKYRRAKSPNATVDETPRLDVAG